MNFLILILGGLALVVLIFSLLLLVAFAYLQLKMMERIFLPDNEVPNTVPNNANPLEGQDRYTPVDQETGVPLDKFTPDFSKPTKLVFEEGAAGHGVEEVEEGDDY